jgi:two-component system, NtrC family, sensor histidine kinase HydH
MYVLFSPAARKARGERVTKTFLKSFAAVLLLVGGFLGYIGYSTNRDLERTVTEQFNDQQLILARQVAKDIETHFHYLETLLMTSDAVEPGPEPASRDGMHRIYRLAAEWNVLAAGRLDPDGASFAVSGDSVLDHEGLRFLTETGVLELPDAKVQEGRARITRDFIPQTGQFEGRRIMLMTARDQAGLKFFIIDPLILAQRHARGVRSGETGYAWVINEDAVFLAHYEERFIDRNSLTVREQRNPDISYDRINHLVVHRLLHGMEGKDWYITGWHRGVISRMKKLMAYTPVHYAGEEAQGQLWSVGLVAPTDEVYGILQPLLYRGWLITGASLILVFSGLGGTIYLSLRWAQMLKLEVDQKTADLMASQAEVRESMDRLLRIQDELLRSERFAAIGEAASHLAHEIKNPLLLMGGFAMQVRRRLPEDSPDREKLVIVEKEAKRLEELLMEVQNFTRPAKPQMETRDINREIEDIIRLVENDLRQRGIVVVKELDETIPPLDHDPRQIRQVLLNLAKNAGEAIKGGGWITFRSRHEDGQVKVSITDTGEGMPPEVLDNLFNPFYTTKVKGTGLGLAVCSRIIEDHGGTISVSSAQGEGSTFTFTLPLKKGS